MRRSSGAGAGLRAGGASRDPAPGAVGVIGADPLGRDFARDLARAGREVVLVDLSPEVLDEAREELARAPARPPLAPGAAAPIAFSEDPHALRDVRFVLENLPGPWEAREPVYRRIDAICPPATVLATNSSLVSVTHVSAFTRRPDRVIGARLAGPAPRASTVEVIPGHLTSFETLCATLELLAAVGREGVVVGDCPGFVSDRLLMLTINEAALMVHERVASAPDVDRLFKSRFAQPLGPCELGDLIGLDAVLDALEALDRSLRGGRFRPAPLLRKLVHAGMCGRKSGGGFYTYRAAA